ncbi:hypothetical protein QL285_049883 [Trifolium repens]|nr:hypothetical protein QL285_049883 [Trifolium repens]
MHSSFPYSKSLWHHSDVVLYCSLKVGMNFVTYRSESFKSGNFDCFVLEYVEHERLEVFTTNLFAPFISEFFMNMVVLSEMMR